MKADKISFEQILRIWQNELWPDRESPIETHSAMTWPLTNSIPIDMDIFKYEPFFYGILENDELVAVNSGHKTEKNIYRSRGLWVDPNFRKKGYGKLLLKILSEEAYNRRCDLIWSIPRKSALPVYTKAGFKTVGDFFDEGMEFGPNIYVYKDLD